MAVLPTAVVVPPVGQSLHAAAPDVDLYFPTAHISHRVNTRLYPALHDVYTYPSVQTVLISAAFPGAAHKQHKHTIINLRIITPDLYNWFKTLARGGISTLVDIPAADRIGKCLGVDNRAAAGAQRGAGAGCATCITTFVTQTVRTNNAARADALGNCWRGMQRAFRIRRRPHRQL